jgi:hypothetical protein
MGGDSGVECRGDCAVEQRRRRRERTGNHSSTTSRMVGKNEAACAAVGLRHG